MEAKITNKGDDYPNCPFFVYLCVTVARDCTEAENTVNLTKLEFMTPQAAQTYVEREGCNVIYLTLFNIMKISTYTTGDRAEMTRQLGSCTVKKRVLAPVV